MRTIGIRLAERVKWLLGAPVWCLLGQSAMAQAEQPASSGTPFVGSYAIVFLCIALGMIVLCNPTRRQNWTSRGPDG